MKLYKILFLYYFYFIYIYYIFYKLYKIYVKNRSLFICKIFGFRHHHYIFAINKY